MKLLKYLIFLCFFYINILSQKILSQYDETSTTKGYIVFDSSSFANEDKMYFTLSTDGVCYDYLDFLYYTYLSNAAELPSSTLYNVRKDSAETTTINRKVSSFHAFFTIEKNKNEFKNTNGEYLYLEFDCLSKVNIENTKMSGSKLTTILVVVFVVIIIIIFSIFIYYYRKKRAANAAMMNINPYLFQGNGVSQYSGNFNYGQQPIMNISPYSNNVNVYQSPNQNYMNNNMNFSASPQNVQVPQNGENLSSNRVMDQKNEKPKI